MILREKFGFIGGGAMAEALISGILKAGLTSPEYITVCDVSQERLDLLSSRYQIACTAESGQLASDVDVLFLTLKPQVIQNVLDSIQSAVSPATIIISIAAGIPIQTIQDKLPQLQIVRVMPNTPVAVGEGMAAFALGKYATPATGELVSTLFAAVGKSVMIDETAMDAVTGLSGSGPGYAFVLIDALADAGVRVGLSRQTAITLAAQTLLGSAKMVLDSGKHPAVLRDMVTSPGGTTIAGIHVLEQQGVRAALSDAVFSATNRSKEMGKK